LKLSTIISIGILCFILVAGIAGIYSQSISLISGNTEMNVVASGSMEPTFHRGDVVIVENNPGKLNVGDIVVYNPTWYNHSIIHRIIGIKKSSKGELLYEIKGDNNPSPDPYLVKRNQIISKVKIDNNGPEVIPKLGYITLWVRGV